MNRAAILAAIGVALPAPALACRLALLLALDVSSSVDDREYLLQRNGLAAALIAPEVATAFLALPQPVALAVYEWSGRHNQHTVMGWRLMRSPEELLAASLHISNARRSQDEFPTALGNALGHATRLFREAPECWRHTVDVSGDGENNDGFTPTIAYRHFPFDNVSVNALAVGGSVDLNGLMEYFRTKVIRGPGAFVELATDYADFERAMRRKIEREVSSIAISELTVSP